jgi:hypothetical protein
MLDRLRSRFAVARETVTLAATHTIAKAAVRFFDATLRIEKEAADAAVAWLESDPAMANFRRLPDDPKVRHLVGHQLEREMLFAQFALACATGMHPDELRIHAMRVVNLFHGLPENEGIDP